MRHPSPPAHPATGLSRRRLLGLTAAVPLLGACAAETIEPLPTPPENAAYPLAEAEKLFTSLD